MTGQFLRAASYVDGALHVHLRLGAFKIARRKGCEGTRVVFTMRAHEHAWHAREDAYARLYMSGAGALKGASILTAARSDGVSGRSRDALGERM